MTGEPAPSPAHPLASNSHGRKGVKGQRRRVASLVALCPSLWSFDKTQDRSPPCRASEVQGQPPTASARAPRTHREAYYCHVRGLRPTPGVLTACPVKALKSGHTVLVSVWATSVNNSNGTFCGHLRSAHRSGKSHTEEAQHARRCHSSPRGAKRCGEKRRWWSGPTGNRTAWGGEPSKQQPFPRQGLKPVRPSQRTR